MRRIADEFELIVFAAGLAAVGVGVGLAWGWALALIVAGGVLVGVSCYGAIRRAASGGDRR